MSSCGMKDKQTENEANLSATYENQQMHLHLYTLVIDHIYMFWSPAATILRMYSAMSEVCKTDVQCNV